MALGLIVSVICTLSAKTTLGGTPSDLDPWRNLPSVPRHGHVCVSIDVRARQACVEVSQ